METEAGKFAVAKAGHDKGRIYVIMEERGNFVKLIDGDRYDGNRYKKKNRKHIGLVNKEYSDVLIEENITPKRTRFQKDDVALAIRLLKSRMEDRR